jgi:acetyl esterase/lipase
VSAEPSGAVIYAHGCAWVNEIAVQHWQLAAHIVVESTTTVVVPIYPLIPFGDAATVVAGFAALAHELQCEHGAIVLAGDSAGGQISLSTALLLRDRHGAAAVLTLLISPGLDGSLSNPLIADVEPSDPWLAREGLRVFIDEWRGELAIDDPRVSPLFGDFVGLGPICTFHGTRDILNPDARLLVTAARAAGVSVEDHEGDGLVHVYPLTPTREGRDARTLIVERVREALARG